MAPRARLAQPVWLFSTPLNSSTAATKGITDGM